MKNYLIKIALMLTVLVIALIPVTALASRPREAITIDVRNRTGAPVEFNYRGEDGITRWVTIPKGVSSLTLTD